MYEIEGATYLSSRETARRLGLHPGTLRNWRTDGTHPTDLPFTKLGGGAVLYKEADVTAWLRARIRSA